MSGVVVNRCDFTVGQYIGGLYRVDLVLGEGSFGKVFKVTGPGSQVYALKLLKLWEIVPELRKPLMDRFVMEFETGLIKSRFLVHSVGHGLECGNPFIVMDYCPKGNLTQYMERYSVDLVKVGREILCGLNDLHKSGKVHRDLKPENVLIKEDGTAALTDFRNLCLYAPRAGKPFARRCDSTSDNRYFLFRRDDVSIADGQVAFR